ncbi:P-loop containing nucleoside triphosphate hydrolase protein [Mycena maculata]|uniref:P-loop containing nucleoside triphosphate hydrolase protein n=1 Tax=Mycena maculata TaxID=230809 RepID=A0AAD7IKQ5_9AGAR|nr:P-loop containing nucleoside triphosphate hydrolase protein [Mycena maculata]
MASFWSNSLSFPLYAATASVVVLLLRVLWTSSYGLKLRALWFKTTLNEPGYASETHSVAAHIEKHGGRRIFAFKVARLAGCLILLSLSLFSLVVDRDNGEETEALQAGAHRSLQAAMCVTYFYASVLAILSVACSAQWSRIIIKHVNTVLLCAFGVYFYRDVFPLATFNFVPMDLAEGRLLSAKIIILFTVAAFIPLFVPRQYIPVDPKNPMPEATLEQTASIISMVFYFFLDPLIFLAYRIPHLKFDQLPPLADYDYAENLKAEAFPHMDVFAGKTRHVLFAFVWVYRWILLSMATMLIIQALSAFISPIGLNRLLNYLENPEAESSMKPWFWILCLFVGPLLSSLSHQWYIFISTHLMTKTTALVTQLVFEHALRIRMKTETGQNSSSEKKDDNLLGKMINLVTTDLSSINEARHGLFLVILVPVQIIGCIVFLYRVLSWSAFVGMGVMVALFPLPGYVAKLQQTIQKGAMKKTDARVQTVTETINVLRMIKMFGWEKQMDQKIADKREEELNWIWKRKLIDLLFDPDPHDVGYLRHITVLARQDLSASKVFSSLAVFDLLRNQLGVTFYCISATTELLDSFTSKDTPDIVAADEPVSDLIGFRDATFAWSNDEVDGTLTPSGRKFLLKVEGELFFEPGCINLVVGPTGSGKTSLLMALLGEMHKVPTLGSWYNLPREQGVAYAAQESWVLNDTIRNNILFNAPTDEERYKKVLYQCCLERDLELFDAGDETEVGEKGLTLSGGQKARVTLARAIYADAKIILLDDVLAALDVHTAKWIVDECLCGDLIKDRTVILVTHNVVMTSKIAEFVVSLGLDGRVRSQGSIYDALAKDEVLAEEVSKDEEFLELTEKEIDTPLPADESKKDGKLIVAEEIEIGHVSWSALDLYFTGMGGTYPPLFFAVLVLGLVGGQVAVAVQTWYLGYWASQYGQGTVVPVFKYLGGFTVLLFGGLLIYWIAFVWFTLGTFRASRTIHRGLVHSVLGTTLRWLDVTPASRIIARCTVDIQAVDDSVAEGLRALLTLTVAVLTKFFAIVLFTPIFFFGGGLVGFIGAVCGRIYLASQLSVKREQSNARAPVLAHFGATIAGLNSVRAYGAQEAVIRVSMDRINRLSRATRTFWNLNRWVSVRMDVLGGLFASSLAFYVVYVQNSRPFNIGFSLTMAIGFAELFLYWVRWLNEFEVQANSLERIQTYMTIEQEPKSTPAGVPPAYWPASGALSVDSLSARYSPGGPTVLHDISFNIKSGERVGVVGPSVWQSSLTLSLLRCIFTEGTVYYDGIPTSKLNLGALRSNITIIPQVPELLVGSLRSNLDMFDQFDDATLNNALRAAGLSSLQEDMDEGKLTLDSEIAAGGSNLSVGQRQIIALARAIVRGSKLLILDEATSAIDYKTDAVIQSSLRTELSGDTTLLTVAHRLQTIMDADKIMVLDAGRIVEFDTPKALLQKKHGLFRALVDESGDKEVLYKMVRV